MGRIGLVCITMLILTAIFAPYVAPHDPKKMLTLPKTAPCAEYLFGTDNYGRDVFSRILYGARVSLEVGIIAVGIGATAGYVFGMLAGYFEGWVDLVIMRVMDILFAFPSILLAMVVIAITGPGTYNVVAALGILFGLLVNVLLLVGLAALPA